jgi:hypothetical protein
MARPVTYGIFDRSDGQFDVIVILGASSLYSPPGFKTLAEAEEWIEDLKALMAACGAPVVLGMTTAAGHCSSGTPLQ